MSKLFIVEGNQTRVLDQKAFDNETLLQDVVERFPEVIALEEGNRALHGHWARGGHQGWLH